MAWFSFHCACQDKVGLGTYFIENAEIGKAVDLFHRKGQNLLGLGIYFI